MDMNLQAKRIMRACTALFCIIALAIAAEAVYSIHLRSDAESFTAKFENLRILVVTKEEALGALKDFQSVQKPSQLCDSSGCDPGYAYEFKNGSIPGVLNRSGTLIANLYFHNGVLVAKHLVMLSGTGCCFASIKEESSPSNRPSKTTASYIAQSNGTPKGVNVWINSDANDAQRRNGYRLNFKCLSPLSTCRSARDIFDGQWTE
jgi:hypothetical protein